MIWFLTGYIVGFLSLMLILVTYEEHKEIELKKLLNKKSRYTGKVRSIKIP